jgi:hypothetical protein
MGKMKIPIKDLFLLVDGLSTYRTIEGGRWRIIEIRPTSVPVGKWWIETNKKLDIGGCDGIWVQ